MKKLICLILTFSLVFTLAACGKVKEESSKTSSLSSSVIETSSTTTETSSVSSAVSSATSSSASSAVKTSQSASQTSSGTSSTVTRPTSTETINIPIMNAAVNYKGKIITPYCVLNSDYSHFANYENSWDTKFYASVYDNKLFYTNSVATREGTYTAIFTCDEKGKNEKELVKGVIRGIYTIYNYRFYYISEKYENNQWELYLYSADLDGKNQKQEAHLKNFSDVYDATVKDSVMYFWIFENEIPCLAKLDPKAKKLDVIKRYPNPTSYFFRSQPMIFGNDFYYYFGSDLKKVNLTGEDTVILTEVNSPTNVYAYVNVCNNGFFVSSYLNQTLNLNLYEFNNLKTPKAPPTSIYKVVKGGNHIGDLAICQSKDKIIILSKQ